MIKTFRHKGLQLLFTTGSKADIRPDHAKCLKAQLAALNAAIGPAGMSLPRWGLHPLSGKLAGHWAVTVNGNWRLTFTFDGIDAVLVDYKDYH